MPAHFCLSVRFLQPYSHGRDASGDPEWPPSPLRVFQALVAAAAAHWNEREHLEHAGPALRWLERQKTPSIVAVIGVPSEVKYRLYVPDNVADKVAKSWAGGREGSIADYRTEKDVCPVHLRGEAVHYVFPLSAEGCPHLDILTAAARSITHLGWGIDMVVANATVISDDEAAKLSGERWSPLEGSSSDGLRVPIEGTLNDLSSKHTAFLHRLSDGGFKPVPPLTAFRKIRYRRVSEPTIRPYAVFRLLKPDASGNGFFDTARHTRTVAGMVRHAVALAAERAGWERERIATYVHGHTPDGSAPARGSPELPRFSYLPLPSIEPRGKGNKVTAIRRVLVTAPPGEDATIAWLRRALSGQDLIDERTQDPVALLSLLPASDSVVKNYVESSFAWSTVTPVIMTGHDDNNPAKAERLLRKCLVQGGISPELAASAQLEWRRVGFRAGVELATRFAVPACLDQRARYHVQIRWVDADGRAISLRGPFAFGAGRYGGLGSMASHRREGANG